MASGQRVLKRQPSKTTVHHVDGEKLKQVLQTKNVTMVGLLKAARTDLKTFVASVPEKDLLFLVEKGCELNEESKALDKTLDDIKAVMKAVGKERKKRLFVAADGDAVELSDSVSRSIAPADCEKFLIAQNKQSIFHKFVKVGLTDFVKSFGEDALKPIIKSETKSYNQCSFKKAKTGSIVR